MGFLGCGVSDASDFLPCQNLNQTVNRMLLQCLRLFPMEFTRNGLTNGSCSRISTKRCAWQPWMSGRFWPSTACWWFPACLTARLYSLWHLPVPQTYHHDEGGNFQNEDHPKGKKSSRYCRDTTEYDIAAFWNRSITHAMKLEGLLESFHAGWRILLWSYVFLLLCLCILIDEYALFCILFANCHSPATLTEVFPCFFLSCKANARVYLAKMGHSPHTS